MTDRFLFFTKAIFGIALHFGPEGGVLKCYNLGLRFTRYPFEYYLHVNCGLNDLGFTYLPSEGLGGIKSWSLGKFLFGNEVGKFVSKESQQETVAIADGKKQKIFYRYGYWVTKRKHSPFSTKKPVTEITSLLLPEITNRKIYPSGYIHPLEIPERVFRAKTKIESDWNAVKDDL